MAQISSITRVGKTEPFELQVARGQVFTSQFTSLVTMATETIWQQGGLVWASVLKVSSSSATRNRGQYA